MGSQKPLRPNENISLFPLLFLPEKGILLPVRCGVFRCVGVDVTCAGTRGLPPSCTAVLFVFWY